MTELRNGGYVNIEDLTTYIKEKTSKAKAIADHNKRLQELVGLREVAIKELNETYTLSKAEELRSIARERQDLENYLVIIGSLDKKKIHAVVSRSATNIFSQDVADSPAITKSVADIRKLEQRLQEKKAKLYDVYLNELDSVNDKLFNELELKEIFTNKTFLLEHAVPFAKEDKALINEARILYNKQKKIK